MALRLKAVPMSGHSRVISNKPQLLRHRLQSVTHVVSAKKSASQDGVAVSMYASFKALPPDGKAIGTSEEMCDPDVMRCKTPAYVYEASCKLCCGTGSVRARSNGKRGSMSTCPLCLGIGYVRHTTTRFAPDITEEGPHMSINRPKSS